MHNAKKNLNINNNIDIKIEMNNSKFPNFDNIAYDYNS